MALGNLGAAGRRVLYVSGEESAAQVRLRAERLGAAALAVPVLAETSLDAVLATLEAERPEACVIDSVQTLHAERTDRRARARSARCARRPTRLMEVAKRHRLRGDPRRPRDQGGRARRARGCSSTWSTACSQFEGERERTFRTLRALKNRFGSTNEVGVFEMRAGGLVEVADPSARFVGEAQRRRRARCVLCAMEGTRPLLVEVQALVAPTEIVPPRRVANGIDRNRLALVLAVLARHGGLVARRRPTSSSTSPAASGSTSRAPTSRSRWRSRPRSAGEPLAEADGRPLACFGEVGLTGELRYVAHADRRAAEARQVRPAARCSLRPPRETLAGPCRAASTLREAIRAALEPRATSRRATSRVSRRLDKRHSELSTRNSAWSA